jgi:hypothetical protein
MVAEGLINGTIRESTSGEIQVQGTSPMGEYCVSNGTFTDFAGNVCRIDLSSSQFLCDSSTLSPSTLFTFGPNNSLLHDGSPEYYACPSTGPGNDVIYNIFSNDITNTASCTNITILTGGFDCAALGRLSSSSATADVRLGSAPTTSQSLSSSADTLFSSITPTASPISTPLCPTDISSGNYIAPHLIIPVSPLSPDYSFGTQYTATMGRANSTIFSFDIPPSYMGTCALIFLFPFSNQAQFQYDFSGIEQEEQAQGGLGFSFLNGQIDISTTYNSMPSVLVEYGTTLILPGSNYVIGTGACKSGQRIAFEVTSVNGTYLRYFESVGKSPIGVFVVPCS